MSAPTGAETVDDGPNGTETVDDYGPNGTETADDGPNPSRAQCRAVCGLPNELRSKEVHQQPITPIPVGRALVLPQDADRFEANCRVAAHRTLIVNGRIDREAVVTTSDEVFDGDPQNLLAVPVAVQRCRQSDVERDARVVRRRLLVDVQPALHLVPNQHCVGGRGAQVFLDSLEVLAIPPHRDRRFAEYLGQRLRVVDACGSQDDTFAVQDRKQPTDRYRGFVGVPNTWSQNGALTP